ASAPDTHSGSKSIHAVSSSWMRSTREKPVSIEAARRSKRLCCSGTRFGCRRASTGAGRASATNLKPQPEPERQPKSERRSKRRPLRDRVLGAEQIRGGGAEREQVRPSTDVAADSRGRRELQRRRRPPRRDSVGMEPLHEERA